MRAIAVLVGLCTLAFCAPASPPDDDEETVPEVNAASEKPEAEQLITAEGTIVSVEKSAVTIDHEGVGALFEPMEMTFTVEDPSILEGLEPGTEVRFWVVVRGDGSHQIDMIERR